MMELIGRQFGHIRVTEVVGEGGMGAVYAGYDEKLDRKVALKVLHADQRLDEEARERLLREARALSKVDHPNICRIHDYIETGDVDLLVLEYIDGRTLQKVIEEGLPHSEKLRIALSVAEVLVRAHRAGIVHRDLKPENVMLTKAGEVKVLDFGLARWLQGRKGRGGSSDKLPAVTDEMLRSRKEADEKPRTAHLGDTMILQAARPIDVYPSGRREFLATAAGITLGTPLYMSPEQARGEQLTPASDMFSFGLLLQVLFTGKEPHPDLATAREVILRVARGHTNPVEGAPKDIAALINSLKQFAPADRPTAVQVVERLQYLIGTPQRIARRATAAAVGLVMLLGGWRYTVDLKVEREKALAAQELAEHHRAKAEDMIEFMLGDLRKKLEPVGRLDILEDAGKRALSYVDDLNPETSNAAELARNSKALNQLVEVRIGQGKLTEALDLANRSIKLTSLAVQKAPQDPEVQLAHGTSNYWVGNVYRLQGENALALERWKSYLSVATNLSRRFPDNETYQLERAYGHSNVASMFEILGDYKSALEQVRLTLEVKSARLMAAPDDPERQYDIAKTVNKLGWIHYRLGNLLPALSEFERELGIYKRLTLGDPQNQNFKDRLSISHVYLARTNEALGNIAAAETHLRSALAIKSELHRLDATNTNWTRNLAMTHNDLSSLLRSYGDYGSAIGEATTARELMSSLIAADAQRKSWRAERAAVAVSLARAQLAAGRTADAAAAIAAARADLRSSDPGPSATRASVDFAEGEILHARGNFDGARKAWTAALEGYAALTKDVDLGLRRQQVITLLRLDRTADAAPLIEQLDRSGYRHPEYVRERSVLVSGPVGAVRRLTQDYAAASLRQRR